MNKQNHFIVVFLLCTFPFMLNAQTPAQPEKTYFVDTLGRLYWNKALPFYLNISPTPGGNGHQLESDSHSEYVNPAYFDTEGINRIRTRFAVDPKTKKSVMPQTEVIWEVYADGLAPVTSAKYLGAKKVIKGNTTYFGGNLKVELSGKDNLSGIKETMVSTNKQDFSNYSGSIEFKQEMEYNLKYFSVDHVGNSEKVKESNFVVDLTAPETIINVTGVSKENIISTATPIYIQSNDELSGVMATYYQIDEEKKKKYLGGKVPKNYLADGWHTIRFWSVDRVGNEEKRDSFVFYLDKLAPILAADVLGDRFIVEDKVYFSGRTKLKLTAVDNKSGIKDVLYSIDKKEFVSYDQPFYLPSRSGIHTVRYYALDNLQNETANQTRNEKFEEYKHNVSKVYVDLTGPSLLYDLIGKSLKVRDTTFIGPDTKIRIKATDTESGLQKKSYSLDGKLEEILYEKPFSISDGGLHKIEVFSYDNVNNRNKKEFTLVVDNQAPEIKPHFSIEPIRKQGDLYVYPYYVEMYLAATDRQIGTDKIFYSKNYEKERPYAFNISGFKKNEENVVLIRSVDKLGNEGILEVKFWVE